RQAILGHHPPGARVVLAAPAEFLPVEREGPAAAGRQRAEDPPPVGHHLAADAVRGNRRDPEPAGCAHRRLRPVRPLSSVSVVGAAGRSSSPPGTCATAGGTAPRGRKQPTGGREASYARAREPRAERITVPREDPEWPADRWWRSPTRWTVTSSRSTPVSWTAWPRSRSWTAARTLRSGTPCVRPTCSSGGTWARNCQPVSCRPRPV